MKLSNKEAALLDRVIQSWEEQQLVEKSKAEQLRASYQSEDGDYKTLTFYAFFAAVSCALLAFGALVLDEKWIERMRSYFSFSEFTIGILFSALSVVLVWYIKKRKLKHINTILANESLSVLLGLSTCVAITYFGKAISVNNNGYYWLILAAAILLGVEAFLIKSKLLWVAMIVALVGWWTTFTYNEEKEFFLGMNMSLRLWVFSAVLLLLHYGVKNKKWMQPFTNINYYVAWILFLSAAWATSLFGNFGFDEWFKLRQSKVLIWAIVYTVLLVGLLYYSIKRQDRSLRDMVLLFLILNIYTRFFEYFWDVTNKGIFFAILALSFWFIGKKMEQFRKKLDKTKAQSLETNNT